MINYDQFLLDSDWTMKATNCKCLQSTNLLTTVQLLWQLGGQVFNLQYFKQASVKEDGHGSFPYIATSWLSRALFEKQHKEAIKYHLLDVQQSSMQQAYRCGSTCCMHSTSFFTPWCNLIAELSKSFPFWVHPLPAFQAHVPQYVCPWNWTWNSKMNTWRPLCKSSLASLAFRIPSSFSTVYSLHCITVLPKDLDIPSATHQVFIARVLPVSVNDSLVIKSGDAANFGLWNAENSDNWQPPTTNWCRKCSEAARNNVKLWYIQPIDPSMVNIYSWLCVFARIFAIECISMKVFKSTTMQRDGHVACHGVLPHICSTWTSPSNHIAFN